MWYFSSPQIVFGEGALAALDEVEGRRALVVTDATLAQLGLVAKVQAHLAATGMEVRVFDGVQPDPTLEAVRQGAQLAREYGPDWIVGLGGGSAIDTAKGIWVLYERPDLEPDAINPFIRLGLRRKARLITIPTTSGAGSEATWAIVLTDAEEQRKLGLGNRELTADMAVVDPELVAALPPDITADTGLDALTQAIEGYTCTWHNDFADGLCLNAVRLVLAYLPRAVHDADPEAREHMHNAATCAGLGFGNAMASLAHAMGHALGATFHVPHGRAVGLFLPYTIEFASRLAPERFAELAAFVGCSHEGGEPAARRLAVHIRDLCRDIASPLSIADLGVERKAFTARLTQLVDDACNDSQMITAPRPPSYEEMERLFVYAYEGRPVDF